MIAFLVFGFVACSNKEESQNPEPEKSAATEPATPEYDLSGAVNYVKNMYFSMQDSETPGDFEVISQVLVKGEKFVIAWSVTLPEGSNDVVVKEGAEGKAIIDVNEKASDNINYTLTAKVTAPDGNSSELSWNLKLPKYALMSWAEYMAAEKEASIVISAVLTGKVWGNATSANVYLEDENGGYYVYSYSCDQEKFDALTVGATYEVSGIKDDYYGTAEIKNAAFTKLDNELVTPVATDITSIWESATDTKDAKLTSLLGRFVTIKGVEMVNITNDGKYINFKRADGLTTYVYISSSSNFVTADEIAELNEKCIKGRLADITGFVFLYNGAAYIIPNSVDSITLQALPEKTDAEKVADAVAEIKLLDGQKIEADLTLPKPAYDEVTITYASSNTELLSDDGKVVAYPLEETAVTFTATVTCGDVSETVALSLSVAALSKTDIALLDWSDAESTYIIEGKIIGKDKYTDFYVADETGVCYVYSKLPEGVAVGDSVRIVGKLTVYGVSKNQVTKEFMPATISKLEEEAKVLDSVRVDLADLCKVVYEDGKVTDEGATAIASRYQGLLYEITGYVRVKTSGNYTNVYIATENSDDAPCIIYNYTNDANDIAAVQALEGKLVTLIAPIHDYHGSYGWRIGPHTNELAEVTSVPELTAKNTCLELYSIEDNTEVEVLGTVLHVYAGNGFILNDGTAGIYVYDKTAPTFNVGDVVRVAGVRGNYNGVAQVQKATLYKVEKIQPDYELEYTTTTLAEFLELDGTLPTNFGAAFRMEGTLVVGNYINLKISDDGKTTNLYLSSDEKAAVLELVPEGVTELPVQATFITYQYRNNAFYVFVDLSTLVVTLAE